MTHLPDPIYQSEFYADVPVKRALAWLVDLVIILPLAAIGAVVSVIGIFFFPLFFVLFGFAYRWFWIARNSATPGMRLMAIELRDAEGHKLDSHTAMLHTLGYTISISVFPLQLASMIFMVTTERGQGLSDMVLGTAMVNRRA